MAKNLTVEQAIEIGRIIEAALGDARPYEEEHSDRYERALREIKELVV